ncbi:MAG: hypothetical protein HYY18_18260 [Planctomycetes bacterium]|nr:hypothetical protein [Planctomycetota bacterium]
MADFANAVHVRTDDQGAVLQAVEEVLARAGYDPVVTLEVDEDAPVDPTHSKVRRFFVSPSTGGWVSVFDENFVEIFDLAPSLSAELKCPVLDLWSQRDRSWGYTLNDVGRKIDQYSTDPNYLEGASQGQPEVLCEYSSGTLEQFRLLFAEGKGLSRASMKVFAKLFGIQNADSDFEDLAAGDSAGVEEFEEFVKLTFVHR